MRQAHSIPAAVPPTFDPLLRMQLLEEFIALVTSQTLNTADGNIPTPSRILHMMENFLHRRKLNQAATIADLALEAQAEPIPYVPVIGQTLMYRNGYVMTFGGDGQQVSMLQGRYTRSLHELLIFFGDENTLWTGFPPAPADDPGGHGVYYPSTWPNPFVDDVQTADDAGAVQ